MSQTRTTEELVALIQEGVVFSGGTALEGPEGIETMVGVLRETAHPDFETAMVAPSAVTTEFSGIEGFREALTDWITPYERFRLMIDEVIVREDRLVFLARQVATTKHDGVEVETESASVWDMLDGQITKATFYLDRRAGLEAAGIEPGDA